MGVLGGGFFLLFGVDNLINPGIPGPYLTQNTIVSVVTCIIGLVFFLLAIKTLRGLLSKQ